MERQHALPIATMCALPSCNEPTRANIKMLESLTLDFDRPSLWDLPDAIRITQNPLARHSGL